MIWRRKGVLTRIEQPQGNKAIIKTKVLKKAEKPNMTLEPTGAFFQRNEGDKPASSS